MTETDYALQPNQIQYPSKEEEQSESSSPFSFISKIPAVLRICCATIIMILLIVVIYYNERLWNSSLDSLQSVDLNNELPTKFYLENMPPNQNQGNRATCWAFSTMAALSHSYLEHGIEYELMTNTDKVLFSPQAYAIATIEECQNNTNVCKEYGKGAADNTTQGGDIAWLSYLPNLWKRIFPSAICPYQSNKSSEFTCTGLSQRIEDDDNPIRFTVNNASTAYDSITLKELLYEHKRAMPLTFGMGYVNWKIPCPEGGLTSDNTEEENSSYSRVCTRVNELNMTMVACPSSIVKVSSSDVCYLLREKPITLDGEMMTNSVAQRSGEHSVTVVGWNDEQMTSPIPRRAPYQSELLGTTVSTAAYRNQNPQSLAGAMGGFIVQNSWDGPSHSMQYWAGEYSTWNERYVCPNPTYPRNWLSCSSLTSNVTRQYSGKMRKIFSKYPPPQSNSDNPVATCAKNTAYMDRLLDVLAQPYEFECVYSSYWDSEQNKTLNHTIYDCDSNKRYFLDSFTPDENSLVNAKFYAVPKTDSDSYEEYTLQHMTEREIANTLTPISRHLALDRLQNDADNCGYHFLPYSYLDVTSQFQRWYSMYYDISWSNSSYLAKYKSYQNTYDYELLNVSQGTRSFVYWDGPLPLANGTKSDL